MLSGKGTAIKIVVGTRGSVLARAQTQIVVDVLTRHHGDLDVETRIITSTGDRDQRTPLARTGSVGFFTKELEAALLSRSIDIAVHSMKDLPVAVAVALVVAAVPKRESPRDVLVSPGGLDVASLPVGARVGTGSPRRRAQLLALRADLSVLPVRGNMDTRLRKLESDEYDAIITARAALDRMGLSPKAVELPLETFLPAPGQGALAVQARAEDAELLERVASLDDAVSRACVIAERELLASLGGGCALPLGALAVPGADGEIELSAAILSVDGTKRLTAHESGSIDRCVDLGRSVGKQLLGMGARELCGGATG